MLSKINRIYKYFAVALAAMMMLGLVCPNLTRAEDVSAGGEVILEEEAAEDEQEILLEEGEPAEDELMAEEEVMEPGEAEEAGSVELMADEGTTEAAVEGSFQDGSTWQFDEQTGVLTIQSDSSNVKTEDYSYSSAAPWASYKDNIKTVAFDVTGRVMIGNYAFQNCSCLEQVVFSSQKGKIRNVGNSAFKGCRQLSTIDHLQDVQSIGNYAFDGCQNLDGLGFSNNLTSIGTYAFNGCTSLSAVSIPMNVTEIGASAFSGCSNLKNVSFEEESKLSDLGASAFSGAGLTSIEMPDSLTSIASSVFKNCKSLQTVSFNNITSIGASAFSGCSSLNTLTDLSHVTGSIGASAFTNCSALTEFKIPDGIATIEASTFSGCSGLKKVYIPASVTKANSYIFEGCQSTLVIFKNRACPYYGSDWNKYKTGYYWLKESTVSSADDYDKCCPNDETVTTINVSAFTEIPDYAFSNCTKLSTVTGTGLVTCIGTGAFLNTAISEINLNKVTDIGVSAFSGCKELTGIDLKAAKNIGTSAFYDCSSLSIIDHFDGVQTIGDSAFAKTGVIEVRIPDAVTALGNSVFSGCANLKTVDLNNTESIGPYAFSNCSSLENLQHFDSIKSFGNSAFSHSGLKEVCIPDGVAEIPDFAFSGCKNIVAVDLNLAEAIGVSAFSNCYALSDIDLKNVKKIGYSAFFNCTALQEIAIPKGISAIYKETFRYCRGLKKIFIPDGVKLYTSSNDTESSLTESDGPFYSCNADLVIFTDAAENTFGDQPWNYISYTSASNNTPVKISYNVSKDQYLLCHPNEDISEADLSGFTNIPDYAFYNCSNLKSVTIPSTVESIGNYAFNSCKSLQDAAFYTATCEIADDSFDRNNENLTISCISRSSTAYDYAQVRNQIYYDDINMCELHTSDMLHMEPAKPATCTEKGYEAYWVCDICGHYFADENGTEPISQKKAIPKIAHNLVYHSAIEPACTTDGSSEYWQCSVCGSYFADEAGTQEIEQDSWIIPACHDWAAAAYEWADDLSTVTAKRICKKDSSHVETETAQVVAEEHAATCEEKGSIVYTAVFENAVFETQTKTVETDVLGHDWGEWEARTDGQAGQIRYCKRDHTHSETRTDHAPDPCTLEKFEMEPTCEEAGHSTYWRCSVCKKYYSDENGENEIAEGAWETLAPLGHDWEEVITQPATCTEDGFKTCTCKRCGKEKTETIPATGHKAEVIPAVKASCETTGLTEGRKCSVCGKTLTEQEVVPAKGHALVSVAKVDPTISKAGTKAHYKCKDCGKLFSDKNGKTKITKSSLTISKLLNISKATVTITKKTQKVLTYNGKVRKPAVTVKYGSKTLKKGTDYTVSYSGNKKVGTAKVIVKGKGKYGGVNKKCTFKIAYDLGKAKVTFKQEKFTYSGEEQKPPMTVKYGSKTLKKGTDYTVKYSNNQNAGTAKVTITGKGKYKGTVKKTFEINKKTQTIKGIKNYRYAYGDVTSFKLRMSASGKGKLTYSNSKPGVATVDKNGKVTLKGYGTTTITITAAATRNYKKCKKTITVGYYPYDLSVQQDSSKKWGIVVEVKDNELKKGYYLRYSVDNQGWVEPDEKMEENSKPRITKSLHNGAKIKIEISTNAKNWMYLNEIIYYTNKSKPWIKY